MRPCLRCKLAAMRSASRRALTARAAARLAPLRLLRDWCCMSPPFGLPGTHSPRERQANHTIRRNATMQRKTPAITVFLHVWHSSIVPLNGAASRAGTNIGYVGYDGLRPDYPAPHADAEPGCSTRASALLAACTAHSVSKSAAPTVFLQACNTESIPETRTA